MNILVTGCGGQAGQAVTQLAIQRNFTVIGVDMRPVEIPGVMCYQVPAAEDSNFLPVLEQIGQNHQIDLLIPTVTEELLVLASVRSRSRHRMLIGSPFSIAIAGDKLITCDHLMMNEVPVPHYLLPSIVTAPHVITDWLGWPCISKPRIGQGGRGVVLYEYADWPSIIRLTDQAILQSFAPGTEYAPNVYIDQRGHATVVVLEKTALKQGRTGNAVGVRRVDAPDVARIAVQACRALQLVGPADVDIRRTSTGAPVVLEINARFGANIAHAPEIFDAMLADQALNVRLKARTAA